MNTLYFHFPALTEDQVVAFLSDFANDFSVKAYQIWLGRYIAKANTFYQMQYMNHREYVFQQYVRTHDVDEWNPEVGSDWEQFKGNYGLIDHERRLNAAVLELKSLQSTLKTNGARTLGEVLDSLEDYFDTLGTDEIHPRGMLPMLDELWFNTVIDTAEDEQRRIRWIPYDQYLQTDHWRRVRGAMLLIHRARCARPHGYLDDGAWGEEFTMHVHHKTYDNRGKERYTDLELLCFRCHSIEHPEAV